MSLEQHDRDVNKKVAHVGHNPQAVISTLGCPNTMLHRVCNVRKLEGRFSCKSHQLRRDRKRMSRYMANLKRTGETKLTAPTSKFMSPRMISRALKDDFGMLSSMMTKRYLLTPKLWEKRLLHSCNISVTWNHLGTTR